MPAVNPRAADVAALRERVACPVLIVGGGIVGIGVFRELVLQGIPAVLVERGDFCSGASSASSHLAHGGLRYLEYGDFRLVREALTERDRLLKNAPHAVFPLKITMPIFSHFSGLWNAPLRFLGRRGRPAPRGSLLVRIGLTLYDFYTRRARLLSPHRWESRRRALARRPALNPAIRTTALYYDAWMPQPERIALDLLADARAEARENAPEALALNYVALEHMEGDRVILREMLSGEKFAIRPQLVLNAGGAWVDQTNERLGDASRFIGGTKGSHLVLQHEELHEALAGEMIYFENDDGRILLCFPLAGRVLVGTTDIRVRHPDEAICSDDEVVYLLNSLRWLFPKMEISNSDVVFRFCGVRPLPAASGPTASISRDHELCVLPANAAHPFPIASLIGGKWTTFRAFSEKAAVWALAQLGGKMQESSVELAIGGGRDFPPGAAQQERWLEELSAATAQDIAWLRLWFRRYGTLAADLAHAIPRASVKPLAHSPEYARGEIAHLARQERVCHLDDLLLRRTLLAMRGEITAALVAEIAEILTEALGWSPERVEKETSRLGDILRERHGLNI